MGKEEKHVVRLGARQRERLQVLIREGASATVLKRAQVLLKADTSPQGPGWSDERIAGSLEVGVSTVHRVRQRFVEDGLVAAIFRKSAEGRQYRRLNEEQEAHLVALANSPPPEGRKRWTYRVLADGLVALGIVDAISYECVRRTLKKKNVTLP
jgi:transposase